jgi:photosystem II stability/assembly factor-like uncharacterized protein
VKKTLLLLTLLLVGCAHQQPRGEIPSATASFQVFPSQTPIASALPVSTSTSIQAPTPLAEQVTTVPPLPFDPGQPLSIANLQLHMQDPQSGWATIDRHVFHTTDAGNTWQEINPPQRDVFYFMDANTAWAASESWCSQEGVCDDPYPLVTAATIWRTTDAGRTWQPSWPIDLGHPGDRSQRYFSPTLFFLDMHTGWLLARLDDGESGQELFETYDGGLTWEPASDGAIPMTGSIETLAFTNPLNGWSVESTSSNPAGTRLWHTVDGGGTWVPFELPSEAGAQPGLALDCRLDTTFRSAGTAGLRLACAGNSYAVEATISDGGQAWHFLPAAGRPIAEGFADASAGWRLVSEGTGSSNWLERSLDGGATWTGIMPVVWEQADFDFVSPSAGWALVSAGETRALLRTIDGGGYWSEIQPVIASPAPIQASAATRVPTATVYPGLTPSNNPPLPVLQAGQPVTITDLYQMNASFGWGMEPGGHLLRTANEGETWRDVTPPAGIVSADGLFPLGADSAWVTAASWPRSSTELSNPAGPVAVVWHTADGGKHWQASQPIPLGWPTHEADSWQLFPSLYFINASTGWLWAHLAPANSADPSTFNKLFRTLDGGLTWELVADNRDLPPGGGGLVFLDDRIGWTGDSQGSASGHPAVYKTLDGGRTWEIHSFSSSVELPDPFPLCRVDVTYIFWHAVGVNIPCQGGAVPFYAWTSGEGQVWRMWPASGNESFLDGDTGWRMFSPGPGQANLVQQTLDGGQTWKTLCAVDWQDVHFSFISADKRLGWAVVRKDDHILLMHTNNGGRYWYEIRSVMANP